MAQTVKELMELGLSKTEAERVVNRREKAEKKASSAIATAEKRLPKAQADLDYATERRDHWQAQVEEAGGKVVKYTAIIAGEGEGAVAPDPDPMPEPKVAASKTRVKS